MSEKRPVWVQQPLPGTDEEADIRTVLAKVANFTSLQDFADRIDTDEGSASHALSGRLKTNGARKSIISIEKSTAIACMPGGVALVEHLAARIGCLLVADVPASAEEDKLATEQVLSRMFGREVVATFRTMKHRQMHENRGVRFAGGPELKVMK